jgi:hypothetical protein
MVWSPRERESRWRSEKVSRIYSNQLASRIWSSPLGKWGIESTDCTVMSGINKDAAARSASTTVPANPARARVPGVQGWRFMVDPLL